MGADQTSPAVAVRSWSTLFYQDTSDNKRNYICECHFEYWVIFNFLLTQIAFCIKAYKWWVKCNFIRFFISLIKIYPV